MFTLDAVTGEGARYRLPEVRLTRGARHVSFLNGGRELVFLRGDIEHKDLWALDLATGVARPLTSVPRDFNVRDFDISPDGRELVLERVQEHSDVVLIDLARRR
jgi:hypothetical protein